MTDLSTIKEHMEVVGADEVHLGTVDKVEGARIKLTKADSADAGGDGKGRHHYISSGLVAAVEGNRVRLSATAANAVMLEEDEANDTPDEDDSAPSQGAPLSESPVSDGARERASEPEEDQNDMPPVIANDRNLL